MIKKLRIRFVAIAMISITLVLLLILGSINIINYVNINRTADEKLSMLADNMGSFPKEMYSPGPQKRPGGKGYGSISPETAFDTRYFSVAIDIDGDVTTINTDKIAAISQDEAKVCAKELYDHNKEGGFWGNYKYIRTKSDSAASAGCLYIFLDCTRELETFRSFLFASVGISLLGLVMVFLLVLFFSRLILRPVEESYSKQKRFITDASHEIKTPLTIIDANIEVMEMENGENEWSLSIRNQIKRLTDLTNQLVFLSRMEEEQNHLTMLDFSLSDMVDEVTSPYVALALTKQKEFSYNIAPNVATCGDEAALRQMLSLLLDNAMKYSNPGGKIHLALKQDGKNKIITLWNTTNLITPGRQDALFERFYRPDSSRSTKTGGHGIGLSVAQAIVLAHKGKITAYSEDGASILFTVSL
ncbi:MAG: HAMP domain-containing sensor histidine kinase [Lachnospiraceae bacterium]|nr:HAMP domain-containing sensor histidine kinase [Lachnospiraceae bacterium]